MKNLLPFLTGCLMFFSACHTDQHKSAEVDTPKTDTTKTERAEHRATHDQALSADMVKAEAPDALVEVEHGYALPLTNDGLAQSPIDIISSGLHADAKHRSNVKFIGSVSAVENLGHTVQVDFAKESITLVNGKTYELKQLHFHTPSEHLIDGMTFPMEMHIVSKLNDTVKNRDYTYTVLAILFRIGSENKFLKDFLDSVPRVEGKDTLNPVKVKLTDLFSGMPDREKLTYYRYPGSLTTPPYTESVNWVIAKKIFEASEEQIATIEKIEGNNARHVRALNNRKIAIE
jgi:carbonic anhydrase